MGRPNLTPSGSIPENEVALRSVKCFSYMRVHCFERSNHHLDVLSSFSMTGFENISFCIRAAFNPNLYYLVEARRKCYTVWDAIF